MPNPIDKNDIAGKNFGRLKVLEYAYDLITNKRRYPVYKCQCCCDDNSIIYVLRSNLFSEHTQSCGCLKSEKAKNKIKHGLAKTAEYKIWNMMKARCYNPNNKDYQHYGGRGISVCDDWYSSFINFYNDMGNRPGKNYSIDRIDVNAGYYKDNCRWANDFTQAQNQRKRSDNNSGYRGIIKMQDGKYRIRIVYTANNHRIHVYLGIVTDLLPAVAIRQQAEIKYWHDTYTKYPIKVYN